MASVGSELFVGAVGVEVVFFLPRPLAHFSGRRRSHPVRADAPVFSSTLPDADKLVRGLLDGLTGVAWGDDSQVAVIQAEKRYAAPEPAGARVAVWALAEGPAVVTLDLDLDEEGDA